MTNATVILKSQLPNIFNLHFVELNNKKLKINLFCCFCFADCPLSTIHFAFAP